MASLSEYLKEVRGQAEACLMSTGSTPEVKSIVQEMANIPLPLSAKYELINVGELMRENCTGKDRKESLTSLLRALRILEKYGCNLANPKRPQFWRTVKHNNPIFRATVGAIKGGRAVLLLYGYTVQEPDGLAFPDDVTDPNIQMVAAVTVEVMALHTELEFFIQGTHEHPEFLERIITDQQGSASPQEEPALASQDPPSREKPQQETQPRKPPLPFKPAPSPGTTPTSPTPAAHTGVVCTLCGSSPSLCCPPCGSLLFCENCDEIFHRHPERTKHSREKLQAPKPDNCSICGTCPALAYCPECAQKLCLACDKLYHSHPDRKDHHRIQTGVDAPLKPLSPDSILQPRGACPISAAPAVPEESPQPVSIAEWQCKSCTVMNSGSSVLCSVCERPRLASCPPKEAKQLSSPVPETPRSPDTQQWTCQFCTYVNSTPSAVCEMCDLARSGKAPSTARLRPPSPFQDILVPPVNLVTPPMQDLDLKRQKVMKEEGQKLVQHIREGERKGVSPEEVYAAICVSGGSNVSPCDWLESELPHLLDEICAMAASVQQDYKTGHSGSRRELQSPGDQSVDVQLSRAEARQAWVAAGGNTEKAVQHLLRNRRSKVQELCALGFQEESACEEALRLSGGDVQGALSLLQRPLLEPFHQRVWIQQPPAEIDLKHPDKQWLCRRLLALYDLPSWGRCELVLSLLLEPGAQYSLEDVVQVVRESSDRDFIKRTLKNECPICTDDFPKSKMQPLTSCQCSVCCECFKQHFTITVRDKHIRDMVCPICSQPDINDPERLDIYFSILDTLLRKYLEQDVYVLFHEKMTEHTLMKDPNFRWCAHCSFGFIYDGDALMVTCPQCQKSFCSECKKPWEPQHTGLTCDQFQTWKRENDPEYQRQGLAGYLRDNGITCPNCQFQYALSRGGCIHFTCTQCRYQFCSGCYNPFHKAACPECITQQTGLHAHHPRDCLFYIRDWDPERLQALLQRNTVEFNTDPPNGAVTGQCGVMEQKEEGNRHFDSPCGNKTEPGQADLCSKHYREYLVSLINLHSIDPAVLFNEQELFAACQRYRVDVTREEGEEDEPYHARLREKLMKDVPLGDKVPRLR